MGIKLNIINQYGEIDLPIKKLAKGLAKRINAFERLSKRHIVSIILVNNEEIKRINKEYRKLDVETDVISFALADDLDEYPYELGDIFISIDKVYQQAQEYGHSNERELGFLIVHGILHLLGYDHITKEEETAMFEIQEQILRSYGLERKL
ncbi:MAG TPA: rRNA maturation RNase YbeY [Bacilli bacterium]|nr:rRNA maturation RNase YbeY [Bacilli bacterium]